MLQYSQRKRKEMTIRIILIVGYFVALLSVYMLNKYYIEEDAMKGIEKIDLPKALLISILNWFAVATIILIMIFDAIGNTNIYKRVNAHFKGEEN